MTDIERMLTDICFYEQVVGDSRRTIICPPEFVESIRAAVEQHDAADIYAVRSSPACPDGKLLVMDEQAMEASLQQAAQRGARSLYH